MKNLPLSVIIGGAVSGSFNRAFDAAKRRHQELDSQLNNVRGYTRQINEVRRLQKEFDALRTSSGAAHDEAKRKLEASLAPLQRAKLDVQNLNREYTRLRDTIKGVQQQKAGYAQIEAGKEGMREGAVKAASFMGAATLASRSSATYQAILRDIGIKTGFDYRTDGAEREAAMGRQIDDAALKNGMNSNALAEAINTLVSGGMDLKEALSYGPLAAKTTTGQNTDGTDVTKMMSTLSAAMGIRDADGMQKALEVLALQGKAGQFEFNSMARYLPTIATDFAQRGMIGESGVRNMGAALQVMRMGAGTDEEAVANLKNWLSKISSEETIRNYKDAGINYQESMARSARNGVNPFEASLELAKHYIESTDAKAAAQLKAAANDAAKLTGDERDRYLKKLEESFKTGDLFSDMQVKSALAAYMQNSDKFREIRDAKGSEGVLDRDLDARLKSSEKKWEDAANHWSKVLTKAGDAIRPVTDLVADGLTRLGEGALWLANTLPNLTTAVIGAAGAFASYKVAKGAYDIARGSYNVLRGGWKARGGRKGLPGIAGDVLDNAMNGDVQQVYVVNMPGSGFGGLGDVGKGTRPVPAPVGKTGWLGRMGAAAASALTGAKLLVAAPSMSSIAAMGSGAMASAGAMVTGAGAAGYGAGTLLYDHGLAGNAAGDFIGERLASLMAALGNDEAKESVARMARYEQQNSQPVTVHYAPTLNLSNASDPAQTRADVQRLLREGQSDIERLLEDVLRKQERVQFAPLRN